jgi:Bacterial TniB protein
MKWMPPIADTAVSVAPSAERLWTARIVHSALEEGLAKMDMAIATYGRREPLSLFCYGEPGTGKTTLAELFIDRYRQTERPGRVLYVLLPCPASPSTILEELLDKLGDPFPGRGTVANRMRRCRALFLRERVRLLVLDELGNFIDSESGRILLAAASWLKTFMMQIAIPVVALGAGETVYRARDGRLYTTNATAVLGCSTQLSGRFQLRHTLGLFDAPGEHWANDPADVDSAEHYRRCGDEFTHLLLKLDDGCLGLRSAGLATPDMGRRLYYATDGRMRPLMNLVRVAGGWALETGGRISRELLADAFELVGRTDDTLQAKANPFEMPTFGVEDLAAAEQTSSQRLDRARTPVAGRVHPARGVPQAFRAAD